MLEPQLAHVANREWQSCGLTWIHRFYSTTHDLPCEQVMAKVVVLTFFYDKMKNKIYMINYPKKKKMMEVEKNDIN